MFDTVVIRTNELCLKGGNRGFFENRLLEDVSQRLKSIVGLKLKRDQGKIVLSKKEGEFTEAETALVDGALSTTFGIGNWSFAARSARDLDAAAATVVRALAGRTGTFKIETRREDKSYPLDSIQVSQEIAKRVLPQVPHVKVDVHDPDTVVTVSVLKDAMRVQAGQTEGLGGMPAGSAGRLACLLSGGLDSPVAAWRMMRRGCRAVLVHCHSYPYVGDASIQKVRRLAERLAEYQGETVLYLVPIADAQREIVAKAPEALRVILYRRFMLRAAEALALRNKASGTVTGDSVGQVASQTLENLRAVSAVATLPIHRPLVANDKEETVAVAKRIGTYAISIERQDDCCSLFMPRSPALRATVAECLAAEEKFDIVGLLADALQKAEKLEFRRH